ncbi:MAG: hypothetical protein ABSF99_10220 [Anaerolineales bacterium]|jgi:hypothetical protein
MLPIPQWLTELIAVISNLAIAVAAVFGIVGLWQWRAELVGKTKFEAARKMILLALQFRDEYDRARNAWTYLAESASRKKSDNEHPGESFVLNEHYARWQRLQPLQETLRKLHEVSWEAEVLLSEDDARLIQPFETMYQDLFLAIDSYFEYLLEQAKSPLRDIREGEGGQIKSWRKIIYGARGDEVSASVDNAANKVKRQLKKYIR